MHNAQAIGAFVRLQKKINLEDLIAAQKGINHHITNIISSRPNICPQESTGSEKLAALNNKYITPNTKPITPNTKYTAPNTKYTAPNTKHIPTRAHR